MSNGECHDRNHVGLEDVMSGKRLPAPELGQNAAFVAMVFGAADRYREALEKISNVDGDGAECEARMIAEDALKEPS